VTFCRPHTSLLSFLSPSLAEGDHACFPPLPAEVGTAPLSPLRGLVAFQSFKSCGRLFFFLIAYATWSPSPIFLRLVCDAGKPAPLFHGPSFALGGLRTPDVHPPFSFFSFPGGRSMRRPGDGPPLLLPSLVTTSVCLFLFFSVRRFPLFFPYSARVDDRGSRGGRNRFSHHFFLFPLCFGRPQNPFSPFPPPPHIRKSLFPPFMWSARPLSFYGLRS